MRCVVFALALLITGDGLCTTAHNNFAKDPLFGISFDPEIRKFEEAEPKEFSNCRDLDSPKWARKLYIFGHTETSNGRLFLVGGYLISKSDNKTTPDASGVFLRVTQEECTIFGPALEPFQSESSYSDVISPEQLRMLADDAAHRYWSAFEGKRVLEEVARQQHRNLTPSFSTALASAFKGL